MKLIKPDNKLTLARRKAGRKRQGISTKTLRHFTKNVETFSDGLQIR